MPKNLTRPLVITAKKRQHIIDHLEGRTSTKHLQQALGLKYREYVYYATYQMFKHLVRARKINLDELLK